MFRVLFSSLVLLGFGVAYAAGDQTLPAASSGTPASPSSGQITYDFCPTADKLVKTDLLWHAPKGWVSYGESFDKHIIKFSRARWIGINVGKIICIYKGDKKYAFPIALEQKHNQLVPTPANFRWSKDLGGRKECISDNVNDCPFTFEKPTDHGNIYENLDFFKGKSTEDDL